MGDGWLVMRSGLVAFFWCMFSITGSVWAHTQQPKLSGSRIRNRLFSWIEGEIGLNAHF